MIEDLNTNELPKVFFNGSDLFNRIKLVIDSQNKRKSKTLLRLIFLDKKFIPTDELVNNISTLVVYLNDNELGGLYFDLYNKLLSKPDLLAEKLKDKIEDIIKNKLHISDEIQTIFDDNDLRLLKEVLLKVINHQEEELKKVSNQVLLKSNPLFLVFTLFFRYNRSIEFESVLWHMIKFLVNDKRKPLVKFKEPPKEIYLQIYSILQRKNSLKQIKKYYKNIGSFYEHYLKQKIKNSEIEETIFLQKQQGINHKTEVNNLKDNLNSLQKINTDLEKKLLDLQKQLAEKTNEFSTNLNNQIERNNELLLLEKKSLYSKMKKDIDFCFQELKIGLSKDKDAINEKNIRLLLERIEKTEEYLNNIGNKI